MAAEGDARQRTTSSSREDKRLCALASPLRRLERAAGNVGVMTVARQGEQFSHAERDVFLYLVGQVSASIENIALHELVSEQAVTDELTGLSNNRRFRELISKEAARAQRFGHDLSLIMLDIDDFKRVNDTYGHLQGDEVLRTIGAVLRSSRAASTSRRATAARSSRWRCRRPGSRARSSWRSGSGRGSSRRRSRGSTAPGAVERHGQRRGGLDARLGRQRAGADRGRRRGAVRGQARGQEPGQRRAGTRAAGRS